MNLDKHNVCLFIKDEEHLEEMREFLESKGEIIGHLFFLSDPRANNNYLQFHGYTEFSKTWMLLLKIDLSTEVTTEQFKKLWE